jgi:ParB family chromosome partitioning protein
MNATALAPAASRTVLPELRLIPIEQLKEHPLNVRKTFPADAMAELAASIREKGIQTPLLVRPHAKAFEIIAGHRRYRCAKTVGLPEVPVLVRELSDDDTLELLLIDNLQRADLHPLEEAEGYRHLMQKSKYDVERIAERIGRSVKYVYDRVKLLQLTAQAQKLFRDGEITAGHAILLARLRPEDQKRAVDGVDGNSPLFDDEQLTFKPWRSDDKAPRGQAEQDPRKPISVRELQAWIDEHVKLEAADADPMLFPATVDTLKAAEAENEKVVRITYDEMTPDELKDGPRAILGRSWKRADGTRGSKTCDSSVIGMVVLGYGRGETFRVCVDKKGCKVHWSAEQKASKQRSTSASREARSTGQDRWELQRRKDKQESNRLVIAHDRWKKAAPAIVKALAAAVKKAPARAKGVLADAVVAECLGHMRAVEVSGFSRGTTAEDLVRYAAFLLFVRDLKEWSGPREFPKVAKMLGFDVVKIVDAHAPMPPSCKKCGCTEAHACSDNGHGCSWVESPDPKTKLGLCSVCAPKPKDDDKAAKRKKA